MKRDQIRGTWTHVVDFPPGPDKKHRRKFKRRFPTRKAEEVLAEVMGWVQRGTCADPVAAVWPTT